jgi:hypothetical protein
MRVNRPAVLIVALLMMFGVLAASGSAADAQSYPGAATLTVSDSNPVCGQTVKVVGTGFLPNALVTVTIAGKVVGTAQTDAQGNFTFPYTLPDPCVNGAEIIRATDGTNTLLVTVTVSSATRTTTATGNLPRTGSSDTSMRLAQGGVLLATRKRLQSASTGS